MKELEQDSLNMLSLDEELEATQPVSISKPHSLHNLDATSTTRIVPESIHSHFLQVNHQFYFKDHTLAFHDQGTTLVTHSDSKAVIQAMLAIAEARGWEKMTLTGSEKFRQTAWLEASLKSIPVKGYTPTEVEQAQLLKLFEKLPPNAVQQGVHPVNNSTTQSQEVSQTKDTYGGVLKEAGRAPYLFKPENEMNFFVTLSREKGDKTLWGMDLERALSQSQVQKGDYIQVDYKGSQPVLVTLKKRDLKGKVVGEKTLKTYRNTWQIERAESFRSQIREEAIKKHPDLAPAYGTLAHAQKIAEHSWKDSPEQQAKFVSLTKEQLAEKIEKGERIPDVGIKAFARKRMTEKMSSEPQKSKAQIKKERTLKRESEHDR